MSQLLKFTIGDVFRAISKYRIWTSGGHRDVANSYKKTILGPWWITLGTGIFVAGLSTLRVALSDGAHSYGSAVAFVGIGFVSFTFVSNSVTTAVNIFTTTQSVRMTSLVPLSTHIFRTMYGNLIRFMHELLFVVILCVLVGETPSIRWTYLLITSLLVFILGTSLAMWLGPLVCRFRDVGPMIAVFQRLAVFLTPIFWSLDQIPTNHRNKLIWLNPYSYFVEVFRMPLLSESYSTLSFSHSFIIAMLLVVISCVIGIFVYAYSFPRLSYWASAL